ALQGRERHREWRGDVARILPWVRVNNATRSHYRLLWHHIVLTRGTPGTHGHPRGLPASISGILMALRTTTRESILGTTVGPIGRFRKRLVTCCTGPHENPFTYKKCPTAACGFHGSRAGEPGVVFGFLTPRTPDNVSGLSQDFPGKLISQPSYLPDRLRRQPWRSPVEI